MSEPTGARRYGTGGGDAYYDAVKYGGYQGTREQFGKDQAEFAQNATAVAEAKEVVEQDTEEVQSTKDTFVNTTVPEAISAVQQEGADQVQAVTDEGTTQIGAVTDEGNTQVQRVQDKGDEVLASIPADYTELTGDVDNLKSAFNEIAENKTIAYDLVWINGSYLANGVVTEYSGWRYTDYVSIGDAKEISFTTNSTSGAAIYNDWYDANKQYISSFSTYGTTLTPPASAKYFRLSCRTSETNTASYSKIEVIGLDEKLSADSKTIVDLQSAVDEILYVSPNLINPEETIDGYYVLKSGAISSEYPNSFITDPIAIEKNVSYKANKTNIRIRIQNANGDLLTVFTEDTLPNTSGVFSYKADAFMIVTDSISNKNNLMVCKATDFPSVYKPYRHSLKLSVIESEIEQSPLNGKKVCWYGDSLIQNNWKDTVTNLFSMNATNCGVGGTKISGDSAASMCQATRINGEYPAQTDPNTGTVTQPVAVPSDAEVIIIGGGTNDWAQNIPLGEKQVQFNGSTVVEDVTAFYQACHVMFRRLHEERPNAKIIVLGTPFALYKNRWTNTYGLLNSLGLSALDYGKALCDVARMWGYFALDYGEYMGINELNAPDLLNPGSDGHLHPSIQTSKDLFARCTIQRLLTIKYLY